MRRIRGVRLDVDGTPALSNDEHALAFTLAMQRNGFSVDCVVIRGNIGMGSDKLLPEVIGVFVARTG